MRRYAAHRSGHHREDRVVAAQFDAEPFTLRDRSQAGRLPLARQGWRVRPRPDAALGPGGPGGGHVVARDAEQVQDDVEVGKTVTRILTDDQLADYQPWFDNQRRLRDLITELETLSQEIADADPRWDR